MRFRKIISYFTLQYNDPLEEQEYVHIKTPFINTFVVVRHHLFSFSTFFPLFFTSISNPSSTSFLLLLQF